MSEKFPRISIVTASYNQGAYIEECILSIIGQQYPNLEYIIMDGGSTDNTVDIIKKYDQHITYWISEKDNGLYDAMHNGYKKATGEIMGWLNSDDLLMRKSLFTLADIFSNNPGVDWVQGHPCVADELGRIVYQRKQRSSKYPFYLKEYRQDGIFIQQESTYWRRNLWERAGSFISRDYVYAGDFELWMRFFKYAKQYTTAALIGAFRSRKGQLSAEYYDQYLSDCDSIIDNFTKELSTIEISELDKIRKAKSQSSLGLFLKKAGLTKREISFMEDYAIEYNYQSQKFDNLRNAVGEI